MAYLVITFDKQEIDRRDLLGPVVIGRAGDCDVAVKDILLSRRHCRIEPGATGWRAVDLDSRNGTTLNGDPLVEGRTLSDGNMLRLGRVTVRFQRGSLAQADLDPVCSASQRPADPNESLSGTIASFTLLEPGEGRTQSPEHLPLPRPEPRAPAAYQREDVYSLLSTIASSSWDSIYAQAKQPLKAQASAGEMEHAPRSRPRSPIDLSLQAVQTREVAGANGGYVEGEHWSGESSNLFPRMVEHIAHWRPAVQEFRRHLPAAAVLIWAGLIGFVAVKNSCSPLAGVGMPRSAGARVMRVQWVEAGPVARESTVRGGASPRTFVPGESAVVAGYSVGQRKALVSIEGLAGLIDLAPAMVIGF